MNVTAIVLAAGRSRRMEAANKLLLPLESRPLVTHVVAAACAAPVAEVVVVTGHDAVALRAALAGYPVRFAHNDRFAEGMGTSIACGVREAGTTPDGFLICPGDLPLLGTPVFTAVCRAFAAQDHAAIVVATAGGRRGHPVLFHAAYRDALLKLNGDAGARRIVAAHPEAVLEIEVEARGIFEDVDTRAAYDRLHAGGSGG